jgi:peroxiredoxin
MTLSSGEMITEEEYIQFQERPAVNHMTTKASISVYRDEDYLTTLQPQMDQYVNFDQTVAIPALWSGLREDLYLVLAGWGENGTMATLKVFINPLANFLWLGGLVFMAGGAIAALGPPVRTARLPTSLPQRRSLGTTAGLVTGLLVLAAAGWTMWWPPGHGAVARPVGRPLPGQPAPDFSLDLLDGSTLTFSELRGQVAVVNFWATWCPSCKDEMPDLQAVWEEYREERVVFVGIAYQDEIAAVREMISRFGITYPQGMDVDGRIYAAYGSTGVPETFVVDPQGNVAYFHVGPVSAEELRGELDSLLGR